MRRAAKSAARPAGVATFANSRLRGQEKSLRRYSAVKTAIARYSMVRKTAAAGPLWKERRRGEGKGKGKGGGGGEETFEAAF